MDHNESLYHSLGGIRTSVSPEKLELMGKEAANLLLEKNVAMNESIPKLAAAYPDINAEQVRRVVEYANTAAYLAMHDKNKTAGAEHSYPQFELADPARVLGALSTGSGSSHITQTDIDYGRIPEKRKLSSAKLDAELEEMFVGKDKKASLDFTFETGVADLVSAKQNLISLKENLEGSGEQMDLMLKQASAEYYEVLKGHLLEGGSFADVLRAAQETGLNSTKIASAMNPFIARVLKEKVASPRDLSSQAQEFVKVAHRVVDEQHPLVRLFGAVVSLQDETEKVASALVSVDEQIAEVKKAIKEEFLAG
jgi:2-hydroxy-3-keto-5-methylthiopentenyl-1-phosphate phosphatase